MRAIADAAPTTRSEEACRHLDRLVGDRPTVVDWRACLDDEVARLSSALAPPLRPAVQEAAAACRLRQAELWARQRASASSRELFHRMLSSHRPVDEQRELCLAHLRRYVDRRRGPLENCGRIADEAERLAEKASNISAFDLRWACRQAQAEVADLPLRRRGWTLDAWWARHAMLGATFDWAAEAVARYYLWRKVRPFKGLAGNDGRLRDKAAALSASLPEQHRSQVERALGNRLGKLPKLMEIKKIRHRPPRGGGNLGGVGGGGGGGGLS